MTEQTLKINDLRTKIINNIPVSDDELRTAVKALRQDRTERTTAKAAKVTKTEEKKVASEATLAALKSDFGL